MLDLTTLRIVVSGGSGFLGRRIVAALEARGMTHILVPRSRDYDLRTREACARMLDQTRPDVVIHAAAVVGGIGANQTRPADFFTDNALMGIHLLREAWRYGVTKFVALGTVCSYPKWTPAPFEETAFWNGYPEETNAPYGLAKKMLLVQAQAYRQQYGFNAIYLMPTNLYGEGDNFDPATSHVIPALVRKFVEAVEQGSDLVTVWGTGGATREFLHVDDAARAIVLATERYDGAEPVNIGSGFEINIRELVRLIAEMTGFQGHVAWDMSKPDGQPVRALDTSRAKAEFGFTASTPFAEGLWRVIEDYREHSRDAHPA